MKPTHRLKVLNKLSNHRTDAGAGWLNADGSISIRINPMVCLENLEDHVITLFPDTVAGKKTESKWEKEVREANEAGPLVPNDDTLE